jgi:putative ABC transport system permease protein
MGLGLSADVKYAIRSFARRPFFTAVILLTLALGIGSNVAIFSVANAILFRPLPYQEPEQLVLVWTRLPSTDVERNLVSPPDFGDYRAETTLFTDLAAAMAVPGTLTGEGPAEQVMAGFVTWNFFELLGVAPLLGRDFDPADAYPIDPSTFGAPNPDLPPGTLILSHGLWQRRFGGDPDIVGRTIELEGLGSVVAGVLPQDFRIYMPPDSPIPTNIDVWTVAPSNLTEFAREAPILAVVGRLQDGVTPVQAQAEMDALAARLREAHQFHATQNMQILVAGMHDDVVNHTRPALLALLGAVAFVLLIACANVANLLLVRATGRGREIAVRAALGSGRGRIVRQMLAESALIATVGGLFGVLLAWQGVQIIAALSPGNLPRIDEVSIDASVLSFTAGSTVLAALLFGLAPALRTVSGNLADSLKDRGADSGGSRGNRVRSVLVVAEVALSMVLLIGAGLMVRSFAELRSVEPGFNPESVVTFTAPVPMMRYPTSELRANFMSELGTRIRAIPGVANVGGVAPLPLVGNELYYQGSYGAVGTPEDVYRANRADYKTVVPGYLETLEIELVAGRTFTMADAQADALSVGVIDEKLAERAFGDTDPIGQELMLDHFNEQTFSVEQKNVRVVGVVTPVRSTSLAVESRETVYVPYFFAAFLPPTFVVRTATEPSDLVPLIRSEIDELDPNIPISDLAMFESYVTDSMAETRFMLALIGLFAVLALVLASLGLYGVISYSARQRTREIGVRVAFGAADGDVVRLVLRHGLAVAGTGITIGLIASFGLTRVVESFLVGVSTTDPVTYVGIPALLVSVALVAAYIPARKAAGVDPVVALRDE